MSPLFKKMNSLRFDDISKLTCFKFYYKNKHGQTPHYRTRTPNSPSLRNRPSPYSGKVRFRCGMRVTAHRGTWLNYFRADRPDSAAPGLLVHVSAGQIVPEYNKKHHQTHLLAYISLIMHQKLRILLFYCLPDEWDSVFLLWSPF